VSPHDRILAPKPSTKRKKGAEEVAAYPINFHLFAVVCNFNFVWVPLEEGMVMLAGAILPFPVSTVKAKVIVAAEMYSTLRVGPRCCQPTPP
jgi:hypothetical protein